MKAVAKILPLLVLTWLVMPRSIFAEEQPQSVSIIQLISNPDAYNGKLVRILGFVRFEFEGNAIYLHEEDYTHGLTKNGLWLSMNELSESKDLNRKYALIEGVFNAQNHGHKGLWSGSIEKIRRTMAWPTKRS